MTGNSGISSRQRDWEIQVDEKQYSAVMGVEFERARRKPGWDATLQQATRELNQTIRPAVCWERFTVREARHERLVLENGLRLGGGTVVSVLGGAEELVVAVLTLGGGADRVVETAQREGNYLKALLTRPGGDGSRSAAPAILHATRRASQPAGMVYQHTDLTG